MNNNNKAKIIEGLLILVSIITMILLMKYFETKGFIKLARFCMFIPTTIFGLYIFFGKNVYFRGKINTIRERIENGLFFLLITPFVYFVIWLFKKIT